MSLHPSGASSSSGAAAMTAAEFRELYQEQSSIYGNGKHGPADLDGTLTVPWATLSGSTYTMTEDALCTRIIVRSGITVRAVGFRVRANKSVYVELTGKISWNGGSASGVTAGTAGTAGTLGVGGAGGAGGAAGGANNGSAGGAVTSSFPTNNLHVGGVGGAGAASSGGAAGAVTAIAVTRGHIDGGIGGMAGMYDGTGGWAADNGGSGGGGGGSIAAFAGGGGGAGGACGFLASPSIANLNPDGITADGGDGAAGGGDGAGGGAPGAGGKLRWAGTLESGSYAPHAYGGNGGAAGGATSFPGKGALPGVVSYMGPTPTASYLVTLSAAECAACIVGGVYDVTVECYVPTDVGLHSATPSLSQGGGGVWLHRGVTAGGVKHGIRYNGTTNQIELVMRDAIELATAALGGNPAAPTHQNFRAGQRVTVRGRFDPGGGAASMSLRVDVDGALGSDTTGVGSGAALAAITSGTAYGTSATTWSATHSRLAGSTATNVIGRVVVLGDSLSAARLLRRSLANHLGRLGVVGPIVSIAQGGDQMGGAGGQLADWTASVHRGSATVTDVVIGPMGWNDIITGGQTAAQMATRRQAIVDDIAAQNPLATIWMMTNLPAHGHVSEAQQAIWVTDRANVNGSGPNPITGVDHVVDTHIAKVGDASFVLRMRGDSSDNLHEDDIACGVCAEELIAAGLT